MSELIGKDVKDLGRAMGLRDHQLETIEWNLSKWGLKEIAMKILQTWKQKQEEEVTEEMLANLLVKIGRLDLANEM